MKTTIVEVWSQQHRFEASSKGLWRGENGKVGKAAFPVLGRRALLERLEQPIHNLGPPTQKDTQPNPELIAFASQGLLGHVLKLMFPPEKKLHDVSCHAWNTPPIG